MNQNIPENCSRCKGNCPFLYESDGRIKGCRPPELTQKSSQERLDWFLRHTKTIKEMFSNYGITEVDLILVGSVRYGMAIPGSDLDILVNSPYNTGEQAAKLILATAQYKRIYLKNQKSNFIYLMEIFTSNPQTIITNE